jgi:hypothetical protein
MKTSIHPAQAVAVLCIATAACSSASSEPGDAGRDAMTSDAHGVADAASDATSDGAAAHSVTLTWHASTTPGVTYTVLRSTASGSGYSKQVSGLSALTWTDTSVSSGMTYYYVVDDSLGSATSSYSNQATARIP